MNEDRQHGMNLIGAALFGALVGASAVILAKEENRKAVKQKMADALETSEQKLDELLSKAEKLTAAQRRKLITKLETAKNKLREE
jgi:hypothetical protein